MDTAKFDAVATLPINQRREEILQSVDSQQVTIITAETGAGKSTQVPQFLAEHGYEKIIVTQPRILAARNLCQRVKQEYSWRRNTDSSHLVGYRTAHEQDSNPENVILYCTDGLQLVRELTGSGIHQRQVLVLDEIHEWNENMEVLLAWAKKRCQAEPNFKIVLMSATIEADSLATYFNSGPPISVAGRSYPVERRYAPNLLNTLKQQLLGPVTNILVFLPGKAEIEQVSEAIAADAANYSIPVIPLHSQLEPEEQQRAFGHYPSGKIVLSTNIAQTSITIDDIDTVIDSGLERRTEVRSGVEGLFISETSQADCLQRAGRAGRTKAGTYILAKYDRMPCTKIEDRPAYGVPEIMRKHIDRLVLRLANVGIDVESLEFFHAPSHNTVKQAKRTLTLLGALQDGAVTVIGHAMERFPVESMYGRMLVEVTGYSLEVQAKLAAIIAIQEVGGIVKGGPRYSGWRRYTHQRQSDLLAQYEVLLALPTISELEYEELGIIAKNVDKAEEVRERLCRELSLGYIEPLPLEAEEIEPLLKSIVAGQVHQLWALDAEGAAVNLATKKQRELSSSTVVKQAGIFAGTPFDLEIATPSGLETLHLVNDITAVDPAWLNDLAPNMFSLQQGKVYYDAKLGCLAAPLNIKFRGRSVETSGTPIVDITPSNQQMFIRLFSAWVLQQLEKEKMTLPHAATRRIPHISSKQIEAQVRHTADGAVCLPALPKKEQAELIKLSKLARWVDKEVLASLENARNHHDRANIGRHLPRRGGWKPAHKRKDRWRNRD